MADFKAQLRYFIQVSESPHLILFLMDYRKEVESSVDGNTVKDFKANLLRIYFDMYKEVNNCPPSSKFYDDVQWCVWEMLFRAVEKRKSLTDDTISSSNGSSEVAGVKRLLVDTNIMDWEIPSPCENGLMIGQNTQNVNRLFYDYQIACLSKFKSEQFYNWRTDIHKLLSLSSIIFLDGIRGECSFLEPQVYQSLYSSMTSDIRDAVTFTSDIFCDLQDILNEYNKEFDYWATMSKIMDVHTKYKDNELLNCTLEALVALLPEMTVYETKRSEMHVQCSYVHNFIKHIFKVDPYHHPHCSNTNNNFYGTRPDYLVDVQGCAKTLNNVFGECKGKGASVDSCNRDKYRLAVFSQVAMQEQKLKSILTFFSKDNEITFYIMKKMNGLFFFCKIAQIKIPTTEADFKSLGVYFNDIAMIRQAYTSNCHQKETDEQQFETLPWSVFSEMACKR